MNMNINITRIKILLLLIVITGGAACAQTDLGIFKNHLDIGDCKHQGFVNYDPEDQSYTIAGSGKNMWANKDEFHHLWSKLKGDFILETEVKYLGDG